MLSAACVAAPHAPQSFLLVPARRSTLPEQVIEHERVALARRAVLLMRERVQRRWEHTE